MHHAPIKSRIHAPFAPISPLLSALSPEDASKFQAFGWGLSVASRFPTIIAGFHHFAACQPETVAVEYGTETITYGDLNAQANALAMALKERGIGKGDMVCLYLQRSIPMVIGLLACHKLGAAYVPQHVGVATDAALVHIAKTTAAKVVLTLPDLVDALPEGLPEVLPITKLDPNAEQPDDAGSDDIAIVLFTSGTTGVPNGVQVTHRNLANILQTAPGDLGMRPGLRVGQILSIAFDMAAWETLGALSNGATLVIRGKSIQETAEKVDVLIATPSILNSVDASRCTQIKVAAVAGEPCPRQLADTWAGFCTFYNSCGPTETTIINTAEPHDPGKEVLSIGRPTPNNTVYILDDDLNPLPIGEKGEMWAGGDCVTLGYLANPELTADRYKPDPFRPGHMMFRTRDLGRWIDTGELQHFGRVDDLVKIRGFRVELDGVSAALEATEACEQAVTLKFDNRTLVSFVSPAHVCPEKATASVAEKLPYYSVPKLVLPIAAMPRTPRGKLDKRLLLTIAAEALAQREKDSVG